MDLLRRQALILSAATQLLGVGPGVDVQCARKPIKPTHSILPSGCRLIRNHPTEPAVIQSVIILVTHRRNRWCYWCGRMCKRPATSTDEFLGLCR